MIDFIVGCIGFMFLWAAVHFNRDEASEIKLVSKEGFIIVLLMTTGVYINSNSTEIVVFIQKVIQLL